MAMQFKIWLEDTTRETARNIVLDALDMSNLSGDKQQNVLGVKIEEEPKILDKLKSYSILTPHMGKIEQFVSTHGNSNLIALINFIDEIISKHQFLR